MTNSIRERVQESFPEDNSAYVDDYLVTLRESLKEMSNTIRNNSLLIIILMAVFELQVRAAGTKVTIGPLEVTDTALIQKSLPAIIAYLFF
jgi:hypothetical protein